MKAGIITITTGENYGNRLQNYAVQEALKSVGLEPETIHKTTNVFDAEHPKYLRKYRIKKFLHYHSDKKEQRILQFHRFTKKYITRSRFVIDKDIPEGLDDAYQVFIAGSDQVWNPFFEYCTEANFLTFTTYDKKVALSPSIAIDHIPDCRKEDFRRWISDFRLLSVRETKGADLIRDLCGRDAEVLGDPTLYLTAQQWRNIEKKVPVKTGKYILTYFLGECTEKYRRQIQEMARAYDLDIYELQTPEHYTVAPDEFLYLIDHAACICTDSFHGAVFSIIFHRPFVVYKREEDFADMSSRMDDLLSLFHMETRTADQIEKRLLLQTDFSISDSIIVQMREKMKNYLLKISRGEGSA